MQPLQVRRHRTRIRVRLAQALIEAALQSKLDHALLPLDHGTHLEQPVGGADFADARRVAAAHDDSVFGLLEDLEVIGDDGALLVAVSKEVLALPELIGGLGSLVFAGKEGALGNVA